MVITSSQIISDIGERPCLDTNRKTSSRIYLSRLAMAREHLNHRAKGSARSETLHHTQRSKDLTGTQMHSSLHWKFLPSYEIIAILLLLSQRRIVSSSSSTRMRMEDSHSKSKYRNKQLHYTVFTLRLNYNVKILFIFIEPAQLLSAL